MQHYELYDHQTEEDLIAMTLQRVQRMNARLSNEIGTDRFSDWEEEAAMRTHDVRVVQPDGMDYLAVMKALLEAGYHILVDDGREIAYTD